MNRPKAILQPDQVARTQLLAPLRRVYADITDKISGPADGDINCIAVNNIGNGRQIAVRHGR